MLELRKCFYCQREEGTGLQELRPYGPEGSFVCAECVMNNPEAKKVAKAEFNKIQNEALRITNRALLTPEGPIPYIGEINEV